MHDLLKPYQIYERPVNQADHAVKLQFGVTLQQIIDMDERNQLLKSNLWLEYMWTDVNLAWNEVSRNLIYEKFSLHFLAQNGITI